MIALHEFLNVMSTDCEIELIDEESFTTFDLGSFNYEVELPEYLRDAPVVHFTPGIVTKIFIKETKV